MSKLLVAGIALGLSVGYAYGYTHTYKNEGQHPVWIMEKYAGVKKEEFKIEPGETKTIEAGFSPLQEVFATAKLRQIFGKEYTQMDVVTAYWGEEQIYKDGKFVMDKKNYTGDGTWTITSDGKPPKSPFSVPKGRSPLYPFGLQMKFEKGAVDAPQYEFSAD